LRIIIVENISTYEWKINKMKQMTLFAFYVIYLWLLSEVPYCHIVHVVFLSLY
jgi:hypothetical protein